MEQAVSNCNSQDSIVGEATMRIKKWEIFGGYIVAFVD
jgi:hypothetical protein